MVTSKGSEEISLLVVRDVDKSVYRKFRQRVLEKGLKLGTALAMAMESWVEKGEGEDIDPRNLLKMSGIIKTKKPVKWSTEVDKVLYGWEK